MRELVILGLTSGASFKLKQFINSSVASSNDYPKLPEALSKFEQYLKPAQKLVIPFGSLTSFKFL
jgi:hypothetical protein